MRKCSIEAYEKCPHKKYCGNIQNAAFTEDSECAKFNDSVENQPMTNACRIRSMSNDQLRYFLEGVANGGVESVWSKAFSAKFCDSCSTITAKLEGYDIEMDFHECEFAGGKCPHGNELDWWLRQPAEEVEMR